MRARLDLLRLPVLGDFLRWRHARTTLQLLLLLLAALVVLDGLLGPRDAARNAAGILPWVHWRGLVALGLLLVGNVFCMACPFMLPRRLAKRLLPGTAHWPAPLRTKWLAVALLFLFFWIYEAWELWSSPWLTAWLVLAYFVASFLVGGFFRGAPFCKYLCPIGHFHFANSLASPFEVSARDLEVCRTCTTRDCIVGTWEAPRLAGGAEGPEPGGAPLPTTHRRGRLLQRGCELWLYQGGKVGNMDCTFCLECVVACPYENVGILARSPLAELGDERPRAGVGRLTGRPDIAALVVFLTFAGFASVLAGAGAAAPLRDRLAGLAGTGSPAVVELLFLLLLTGLLPATLVGGATLLSRPFLPPGRPFREVATRFSYGLVPLGLGMWAAYYLSHFLGAGLVFLPALRSRLAAAGPGGGAGGAWEPASLLPGPLLLPVEILVLVLGAVGALVALRRIARKATPDAAAARSAFFPWAALTLLLVAAGIWLLRQPGRDGLLHTPSAVLPAGEEVPLPGHEGVEAPGGAPDAGDTEEGRQEAGGREEPGELLHGTAALPPRTPGSQELDGGLEHLGGELGPAARHLGVGARQETDPALAVEAPDPLGEAPAQGTRPVVDEGVSPPASLHASPPHPSSARSLRW